MPRLSRLALLLSLSFAAAGHAIAGPEEDQRARNAVRVLNEIQKIPEQSIPDKLLDEARAIVVIPDTIKAGLVIGGRRGHGLMSMKNPDGSWSQPVFVKLTGGSIGFQAGVQSSDVVLVFRNDRSLDNIVNGKFTLGADAGVAAGPGWRQPREVALALLFHDAIYEPGQRDNEARSAALARETIPRWWPAAGIDDARVAELIGLTARHGQLTPQDVDADAALMLDCDMAILAAPPAEFDAYDQAIAEEYRGHVPAFLYRINRRRFLRGVLAQPRIFLSDWFHARCDAQARANLRRAIG